MSVSWLYKWLHREPTDRQRRRAELDMQVAELFAASKRSYRWPRIHADLLDEGRRVSVTLSLSVNGQSEFRVDGHEFSG